MCGVTVVMASVNVVTLRNWQKTAKITQL